MNGATPIPPEKLLEETRWLQSLARRLAGPENADDLAQTTWLRALEQPPDRIRGLRPWLRTVLRHAFQRDQRDQVARERRERVASRPEAMPSAAALAARTLLHRAVADAVLSLDEPGRSTVILRFFEDRKPQEIARMQNIAVATVHTRLRRALAVLREKLDRDQGGREAWSALAVPAITGAGVVPATAAASVTAAKNPFIGALLMSLTTKTTIGAACAALLAVAVIVTWHSVQEREGVASGHVFVSPDEEVASGVPVTPEPATRITPRDAVAEPEPAATAPTTAPSPIVPPDPRRSLFIKVDEAKEQFDLGVQFFDARRKAAFDAGHVTGAVMLDPTEEAIVTPVKVPPVLESFDRRKPVIVYDDRENSDSAQLIAIQLRKFGFTKVRILEEGFGFQSWRTKGHPVEATR